MSAAVNVISMTLIQQPGKEKLLSLKTKTHSFHIASKYFLQAQFFAAPIFHY